MNNRQRRQALAKDFSRKNGGQSKPRTKGDGSWKKFYANKKSMGLCAHCPEKATIGTLCLKDWFKNVSSNHFGTRKFGDNLLELMEKQGWGCAYTGVRLVPGQNASLDHKIPITKKGILSLENVQWVSTVVNRMKSNMTDEEFIGMCRLISNRRT